MYVYIYVYIYYIYYIYIYIYIYDVKLPKIIACCILTLMSFSTDLLIV